MASNVSNSAMNDCKAFLREMAQLPPFKPKQEPNKVIVASNYQTGASVFSNQPSITSPETPTEKLQKAKRENIDNIKTLEKKKEELEYDIEKLEREIKKKVERHGNSIDDITSSHKTSSSFSILYIGCSESESNKHRSDINLENNLTTAALQREDANFSVCQRNYDTKKAKLFSELGDVKHEIRLKKETLELIERKLLELVAN